MHYKYLTKILQLTIRRELLKDTDLFPCFDPHYYQCSRTTTSKEVEVVFQRALKRQEAVSKHQYENFQNGSCAYVVFEHYLLIIGTIFEDLLSCLSSHSKISRD